MTKRQRVAPKPVTVLQLWRQARQKQFAAETATATTASREGTSAAVVAKDLIPIHILPSCTKGSMGNESSQENDDWMQLGTGVFELSGEAGAGKTQVALSLCQRTAQVVPVLTPGPTALYLSLGAGRLPKALQRLQQMANETSPSCHPWLFRLLTKPLLQRDDWTTFLREADSFFTRHHASLRLVVVDSLADLVRDDFGHYTQFDRTTWLLAWVQRCQVLADRYQITWLLVNQQATSVSSQGVWESKPALGLAWAHAVQGSWICHRAADSSGGTTGPRRLVLHKSNRFPVGQTAHFFIQKHGIQRVDIDRQRKRAQNKTESA